MPLPGSRVLAPSVCRRSKQRCFLAGPSYGLPASLVRALVGGGCRRLALDTCGRWEGQQHRVVGASRGSHHAMVRGERVCRHSMGRWWCWFWRTMMTFRILGGDRSVISVVAFWVMVKSFSFPSGRMRAAIEYRYFHSVTVQVYGSASWEFWAHAHFSQS